MDAQKLDLFKQVALQSGYSPEDVDGFISSINIGQSSPTLAEETFLDPNKSFAQMMAETGRQSELDEMGKQGFDASQPLRLSDIQSPQQSYNQYQSFASFRQPSMSGMSQSEQKVGAGGFDTPISSEGLEFAKDLPPITQPFGKFSAIEKYSGGVNLGTDFRLKSGTPLAAPAGEWKVVDAKPGFNQGSGNIVKIQSTETGETIGFEHLSKIGVQPGEIVKPGTIIGLSGGGQSDAGRGNSTGAHASIPYKDAQGNYRDITQSPYAKDIFTPQPISPETPEPTQPALPEQQPTPLATLPPAAQPIPEQPKMDTPAVPQGALQTALTELLDTIPENQRDAATTAVPALTEALKEQGITDPKAVAYALATAAHESGFVPKEEQMAQRGINARNDYIADLQDNYDGGKAYRGRGYIQLTGKGNYELYGKQIGVDLVQNPDLANDPVVAAKILAAYMKNSGSADAAQSGDYNRARVLVQGKGALNSTFMPTTQQIAQQAQSWEGYIR